MNQRIEQLRAALEREHLDALLISSEQNRYYLSGFSGSAGFLLISAEQSFAAFRLPLPRAGSDRGARLGVSTYSAARNARATIDCTFDRRLWHAAGRL